VRGLSVIIPAHNAAGTLGETLASLQSQTFLHWEAIVVDDASTDATSEVTRTVAAADPRVRVIAGPGNGPGAARNEGIAHASADWLLFLDADDLIEPEHLERMAAALESEDLDGALCGWVRLAPDGRRGPEQLPADGDLFPLLACYCAPAIHSCVVRRSLVEEVGGFDPSLRTCEDWDLWQRLARAGAHFARLPEVLALYRMLPESASHDPRRLLEDGLRVIDRGHAEDPRVPRPAAAWAAGQPTVGLPGARLQFATWVAGIALGRGEDARPLLDMVAQDRDPGLAPSTVAGSLFQAALLPACRMPEDWIALWPEIEERLAEFLVALETASGARHLAALSQREMERLAIERATAPRPFTLGSVHAVRVELTEPIEDIQVSAPVERLHVAAALEGDALGSIELPVVLGMVPAELLTDALADRFAWTVLSRFLERQGLGPFGWELFLQEIWGRPGWPMARFYDPAGAPEEAPRIHPVNGLLEVEVSGEVSSAEISGPADVALRVGGATIGRLRLPVEQGLMEAQALRAFLTGASGFELCRAAVREALLGQPPAAPGTLRERLAAAALRKRTRDGRGVLLARHPHAPLTSPASRLAFLPAAALPELLDLADATGQGVAHLPEEPSWVLYAPDCFAQPAPARSGAEPSQPLPSKLYGREHFEKLFASSPDPWRYTSTYEETKYEQTLSLLPEGEIRNALELACAEGHFTLRLAPRVGRLVAADISRIALERAAGRCGELGNVDFAHVDLTRDQLPGGFDLIVCSEVLYFAGSVAELREVARRLSAALLPGGHLLTAHASLVVDEPDRLGFDWDFPFGAKVIGETLTEAGDLRLIRELRTPLYRIQLFRKEDGTEPPSIEKADHGPLPPKIAQHVLWNGGSPRRSEAPPDLRTWNLPILLYHRIAPDGAAARARYRVTPEAFEEQLRFLRDSGYHTPRLGEWLRALETKEPLPGRAVLFTFDDGYRDFAEHAWPLLRRHGFSALVFLVADAVGGLNQWDEAYGERLPLLGWEEIRRLCSEGLELGSHTATHRPLTALSATEVVREVARSRAVLTRGLGAPVEAIAYPHGAIDEVVRHLTGACGYRSGLTTRPARSGFDDPPLALPRLEVRGDASFADFVALLGGG
jgi:peptidoglycan/xylan/chitin deacetylase (PgdA/CDA1 family)